MTENKKKLDLDTFGEIMDKFLTDAPIQMLIELPEGTEEATVKDNTDMGPTVQFFILLRAANTICKALIEQFREMGSDLDTNGLVDSLTGLMRRELKEAFDKAQEGDNDE